MIIQAIGLLDDLDKELNTYAMRVREWFGWHFPELTKIVQDNIVYAKTVKLMGDRVNAAKLDFSEVELLIYFGSIYEVHTVLPSVPCTSRFLEIQNQPTHVMFSFLLDLVSHLCHVCQWLHLNSHTAKEFPKIVFLSYFFFLRKGIIIILK